MDVARTALRKGAQRVTVFARSNRLSASKSELDYAKIDGVDFKYNLTPVEFTDKGVVFKKVDDRVTNKQGIATDNQKLYLADSVIIAISQGPRNQIVSTTNGIDTNQKGLLVTDNQGSTTRADVFAAGDVVLGAKTVVEVVAHSKLVANAMDEYVNNKYK